MLRLADGRVLVNGGPPGLIFGLIVAIFYYSFIGLSLAEVGLSVTPCACTGPASKSKEAANIQGQFASSVPTAGGVYHWATIAGGKRWGRALGFFTGWINFYGWVFSNLFLSIYFLTLTLTLTLIPNKHNKKKKKHWGDG
jgi:choline transport protein